MSHFVWHDESCHVVMRRVVVIPNIAFPIASHFCCCWRKIATNLRRHDVITTVVHGMCKLFCDWSELFSVFNQWWIASICVVFVVPPADFFPHTSRHLMWDKESCKRRCRWKHHVRVRTWQKLHAGDWLLRVSRHWSLLPFHFLTVFPNAFSSSTCISENLNNVTAMSPSHQRWRHVQIHSPCTLHSRLYV